MRNAWRWPEGGEGEGEGRCDWSVHAITPKGAATYVGWPLHEVLNLPSPHLFTTHPPTCHLHVLIAVQHDAHRPLQVVAGHRDGRMQEDAARLLAAETAAKALGLGDNLGGGGRDRG